MLLPATNSVPRPRPTGFRSVPNRTADGNRRPPIFPAFFARESTAPSCLTTVRTKTEPVLAKVDRDTQQVQNTAAFLCTLICCHDDKKRSVPHSEAHDATATARYPMPSTVLWYKIRLHQRKRQLAYVLDKVVLARYRVELARFKCGSVAGLGHVLWRDRARRARARAREGCAAARFSACRAMRSPAPGTCGKANRVCHETCVCDKIEGNEGDGRQEGSGCQEGPSKEKGCCRVEARRRVR